MDQYLHSLSKAALLNANTDEVTKALESGKVLYLPDYSYVLNETMQGLLMQPLMEAKRKNLSYHYQAAKLSGLNKAQSPEVQSTIEQLMRGYAEYAKQLIDRLLPIYQSELRFGRTSFRPVEIRGRKSSKRKDDTRLHVDAFPSSPVNGERILRVFCNINPQGEPRVWNLGQPFAEVVRTFCAQAPKYRPWLAKMLQTIKATKGLRSAYDHYMLQLHDRMKLDARYQSKVKKRQFDFPPFSTWIVYTDQVSHAALSGQFLLEQTFYLPVDAMQDPEQSPLRQLERHTGRLLV